MDTRIDADRLRDRFRGCMVGLAVGDALGMPVETMTREEILDATGDAGVTGYLAPIQTTIIEIRNFRPGQWTDDTQLALAIARSLVRRRGFDLADIAAEHVVEYRNGRCGWGRSTEIGIREIMEGTRRPGDPVVDPQALGLGNGVAMKVAPLALFSAMQPGELSDGAFDAHRGYPWDELRFGEMLQALAELTHRDACARIGAYFVALAIHEALLVGSVDDPSAVQRFAPAGCHLLARIVIPSAMARCEMHGTTLSSTIEHLLLFDVTRRAEALQHTQCDVRESVPFVLATCLDHLGSFRDGVLAAVSAGGDTDSNAAMVGAILGAFHGLGAIPPEWVDGLETHNEIIALADQLFELACSRT